MKTIILTTLSIIALLPSFARADAAEMTCKNIEILEQDDNGNVKFTKSDFAIEVSKLADGYMAKISSSAGVNKVTDVAVEVTSPSKLENVKDMVALMAPNVKWSNVASVKVANIGTDANRQDGAGIYLFELVDAEQKTLTKLVTIGWGFGRCEK